MEDADRNGTPLAHPKAKAAVLAKRHARIFAFLLDISLVGIFTMMILTTAIIPERFSSEMKEFQEILQKTSLQEGSEDALNFKELNPAIKEMIYFCQAFTVFAFWIYFAMSDILMKGSSLGKKVFSIRVANVNTLRPPPILDSLLRAGLKTMALLAAFPLLLINFFVSFFTQKSQAGHDFLCRTIVIEDRGEIEIEIEEN